MVGDLLTPVETLVVLAALFTSTEPTTGPEVYPEGGRSREED